MLGEPNRCPRVEPVGECPLCGDPRASVLHELLDRLHGIEGRYTYRRCVSCKTVYQDPRIISDDLALAYPKNYYTHGANEALQPERTRVSKRIRDRVRAGVIRAVKRRSR